MFSRTSLALVLGLCLALLAACDRNIEPYSDDPVEQPDLSRIFPEGAQSEGTPVMPPSGVAGSAAPGGTRNAPSPRASTASGRPLLGTIRLADALADKVPAGAILFVIARGGPGPPVAVLRVPDPQFPLDFEIGPEHRMIEQIPFAGEFEITARIDADGNAMSREPGDLAGAAAGRHAPGSTGIEIVIDELL